MKLSSWLTRLSSRRQVQRPVRTAEVFEPRALMDGTMPELLVETTETPEEVVTTMEDGEFNPEIMYFSLGGSAAASPISQFGSREELGEHLLARALARYDGLFDQPSWWYRGPIYFRSGALSAEVAAPASGR